MVPFLKPNSVMMVMLYHIEKIEPLGGGGLMLFVNENIPSKKLTAHILPNDVEILCTEINLKKQKWVIIGIYNPPNNE